MYLAKPDLAGDNRVSSFRGASRLIPAAKTDRISIALVRVAVLKSGDGTSRDRRQNT